MSEHPTHAHPGAPAPARTSQAPGDPDWTHGLDPAWVAALAPAEPALRAARRAVRQEVEQGRVVHPEPEDVLRAFRRPFADVRVLVVGQDPYPTPGHATGMAFAVRPDVRPVPRSLRNVYTELADDVGAPVPDHGDLTPWADQGVLLLNRVLTVRSGSPGPTAGSAGSP
ncbi:hypothetical protein GCM10025865_19450 [Paraoerskovia sediminicola]|uniref:uracil-DNA glycosylase n=1 Tax=Paraoerskovia sediminicola TaxID=1138587 RepID=A0ABN6XGB9_9CELL|nr:hypothetical protein GCM10025865_19450 [Paraoerskovia sediminicola]